MRRLPRSMVPSHDAGNPQGCRRPRGYIRGLSNATRCTSTALLLSVLAATINAAYAADLPFATSWVQERVYTKSQGLASVEAAGILYTFYRGDDNTLKLMAGEYNYETGGGLSWTSNVDNSPMITMGVWKTPYDSSSGKVFVAVRTTSGHVQVAEGKAAPDGISSWTW